MRFIETNEAKYLDIKETPLSRGFFISLPFQSIGTAVLCHGSGNRAVSDNCSVPLIVNELFEKSLTRGLYTEEKNILNVFNLLQVFA